MTDDELIETFERGAVPEGGFHHVQHVRAARAYLCRHPLPDALCRFTSALRSFAVAHGKPELYHDTVTVAFLLIIAERLADEPPAATWTEFATRHADLLAWKPSVLDRYYTHETLWSERARRTFVMPDRLLPA